MKVNKWRKISTTQSKILFHIKGIISFFMQLLIQSCDIRHLQIFPYVSITINEHFQRCFITATFIVRFITIEYYFDIFLKGFKKTQSANFILFLFLSVQLELSIKSKLRNRLFYAVKFSVCAIGNLLRIL